MSCSELNAINYQIVIDFIESFGEFNGIVFDGRPHRGRAHGAKGRNNKAWYQGSVSVTEKGDVIIRGAAGEWHGDDNNKRTFPMGEGVTFTDADKALFRKQQAAMRKAAADEEKARHLKTAKACLKKWNALNEEGESGYLVEKNIGSNGMRFTKDGAGAIAIRDVYGKIHSLQFFLDKSNPKHKEKIERLNGSNKRMWPTGSSMRSKFASLGKINPRGVNIITEGWATGCTLHEASAMAVVVALTANNILPVIEALVKHYPKAKFLIAADDDYLCRCQHCKKQTVVADENCAHCSQSHGKKNTGISVAMNACSLITAAEWFKPDFVDRDGKKLSDFNDLMVLEGLQVVAAQVDEAVSAKFPSLGRRAEPRAQRSAQTGGAGDVPLSFMTNEEVLENYVSIYGVKDVMYDRRRYKLVPRSCVMDMAPEHAWREVRQDIAICDLVNVDFDASESDKTIQCNMYAGWQSTPDPTGSCEKILELLRFLCSKDDDGREAYHWILKWLAYPIQHPGAKLKTCLVFHGPTRVGKNLFFDAFSEKIYGKYARTIGQAELEDKFNDWASQKLFIVANEIVARQDLFHQKNKLKGMITDPTTPINPKNIASHVEKNQMNLVFLSNEMQPVVPDVDDERFLVIYTPSRREKDFYTAVYHEIENGGMEALHDYLLNVDLDGFGEATHPPMTRAKKDLVELSKDSVQRFYEDWTQGHIEQPYVDCLKSDLFESYRRWCSAEGERFPRSQIQFSSSLGRFEGIESTSARIYQGMADALVSSPLRGALETKMVRYYKVPHDANDIVGKSIVEMRTRYIVRFRDSLSPKNDF